MSRNLVTYATFIITAAACLVACVDGFDSPGMDPPSTVAITFAAIPTPDGLDPADEPGEAEGGDDIDISRLQIQFDRIELRPAEGEVQPFTDLQVDALDPQGRIVGLDAAVGTYTGIDLSIGRGADGSGIDGTDAALWFEGTVGPTRFRAHGAGLDRIQLDNVGLEVDGDGVAGLAVDLDATRWLDGVRLDRVPLDENGVAVITDAPATRAEWQQIVRNVHAQVRANRVPPGQAP